MKRYADFIQDTNGRAIEGVSVSVYLTGTTTLAVIYGDNGITPIGNPQLSEQDGSINFYAANGTYDLVYQKDGYSFDSTDTANLIIFDPNDGTINFTNPTSNGVFRLATSATDVNRKEFTILHDITNNRTEMQAIQQGVSTRPICINPDGGPVLIGTRTAGSGGVRVRFNTTISDLGSTTRPGGTQSDVMIQCSNDALDGGLKLDCNGGHPVYLQQRPFQLFGGSAKEFSIQNDDNFGPYMDLAVRTSAPSAPASGFVRLYAIVSGGKVQLNALFPTGVAQQLEIEP